MKQYMVRMVEDGKRKYYYILDSDAFQLVPLPTKYLKHKIEANRSPNTVRRVALSLCYYLQYLSKIGIELTEVSDLGFEDQSKHFVQFLYWLKEGRHIADNRIGKTGNGPVTHTFGMCSGSFYIWRTENMPGLCGCSPIIR